MSGEFENDLGGTPIAAAQNQKEATANAAFDHLTRSTNYTLEIVCSPGTVPVSAANFGAYGAFKLTGAITGSPNAFTLSVPATNRRFAVLNTTSGDCTINNGGGTAAALGSSENAEFVSIFGDGVYKLAGSSSSGVGVTNYYTSGGIQPPTGSPTQSHDNALSRWDGTDASRVQDSPVLVEDDGSMYGMGTKILWVAGDLTLTNQHKGYTLICDKATLITLTAPAGATCDANFYCTIIRRGAGPVKVVTSGGEQLDCDSKPNVNRAAQLLHLATSQTGSPSGGIWGLYGDLAA